MTSPANCIRVPAAARRRQAAYGDFQTPPELAHEICRTLADSPLPLSPVTIIEPTCGTGSLLEAAVCRFPAARRVLAFDINRRHVAAARERMARLAMAADFEIRVADFFQTDWEKVLAPCAEPFLLVGNPPWVTNSALGRLSSDNHPAKENRQGLSGLAAMTGKSNFDVSEWMIVRLLEAAAGRQASVAMLCKTAVAHKVLARAWKCGLPIEESEIRPIDAARHFGAQVEACLLTCRLGSGPAVCECAVRDNGPAARGIRRLGLREGRLVADVAAYDRVRNLVRHGEWGGLRWRSGVKHDCAAIFEFRQEGGTLRNGLGEEVDLEGDHLFPLLKSSQLAGGETGDVRRRILVPQRSIGEDTRTLAARAPKTWRYLLRHAERLDRRASSVYRNQPRFAVFGVGPYTFCRWKVAVSGFYKTWRFVAVGPCGDRPVLCDDTCYFLPCPSGAEARRRAALLNGQRGREFFSAFVFNQAKRPLTAEILGLLDLDALAGE